MNEEYNTVTISTLMYNKFVNDSELLDELYDAGLDNWEGYEIALESLQDKKNKRE